jgi:hypothetical protein
MRPARPPRPAFTSIRSLARRLLVVGGLLICGWLISSLQSAHAVDLAPPPVPGVDKVAAAARAVAAPQPPTAKTTATRSATARNDSARPPTRAATRAATRATTRATPAASGASRGRADRTGHTDHTGHTGHTAPARAGGGASPVPPATAGASSAADTVSGLLDGVGRTGRPAATGTTSTHSPGPPGGHIAAGQSTGLSTGLSMGLPVQTGSQLVDLPGGTPPLTGPTSPAGALTRQLGALITAPLGAAPPGIAPLGLPPLGLPPLGLPPLGLPPLGTGVLGALTAPIEHALGLLPAADLLASVGRVIDQVERPTLPSPLPLVPITEPRRVLPPRTGPLTYPPADSPPAMPAPAGAYPADAGHAIASGPDSLQSASAPSGPAERPFGPDADACTVEVLHGTWPPGMRAPGVVIHLRTGLGTAPFSPGDPATPAPGGSTRALTTSSQNDGTGDTPAHWEAHVTDVFMPALIVAPPAVRTAADEPALSPD